MTSKYAITLLALGASLLGIMGLAGCQGASGTLGGHLGGGFNLGFDRVRSFRSGNELVLIYETDFEARPGTNYDSVIVNQPARLTFFENRQSLNADDPESLIPLVPEDSLQPIVRVEHFVLYNDVNSPPLVQEPHFPQMIGGFVKLQDFPEEKGDAFAGEFHVDFLGDKALDGKFQITLGSP